MTMRKGKDADGLPVVTRDSGTMVGKVEDLVLDRQGSRVLGILVDEAGWFTEAKVVAWPSFRAVGVDSVIIDEEASVKKASEVREMREVLEGGTVLIGVQVKTDDGRELGEIEDFYFDPETGVVNGFELSGVNGRSFLPAPAGFEAGRDVAFVDPSAAETIIDLEEALRSAS
jgi:uncharacterized protein YrrD